MRVIVYHYMRIIIEMLKEDEHYYGDFGKKYLSNSDIKTLLNNPLELKTPSKQIPKVALFLPIITIQ